MFLRFLAVSVICAGQAAAQLTPAQRLFDFQQLIAITSKNYAPLEWKRRAAGFDLLDTAPWLDRARVLRSDLELADLSLEYLARLDDGHATALLPSDFSAFLGITADIYDGRLLIDGIDRRALPPARFDLALGDEITAIDGVSSEEWLSRLSRYGFAGNPRADRRFAALYTTFRAQVVYPFAHQIGATATVEVRKANGDLATYDIPWRKSGTPLESFGRLPDQRLTAALNSAGSEPADLRLVHRMANLRMSARPASVAGFGSRIPYYNLPRDFRVRLGRFAGDIFVSGTFEASGLTLGFIRIPDFGGEPPALNLFLREIQFFQQNTQGLIIDVSRNPGGDGCYTETLLSLLIPYEYTVLGYEIRPTAELLAGISASLDVARARGAEPWIVQLLDARFQAVRTAYRENRGVTGPLPICSVSLDHAPLRDRSGTLIAYDKPILVLTDELSASAADAFAATLQDNNRAVIFGMRTMGLGGALFDVNVPLTTYSELRGGITGALMVRPRDIATSEYPTAPYIENIGVRPDIYYDYMTRENLMTGGADFVRAFTQAAVNTVLGR